MNKLPKGQALLITLLIMAVALTIGLSIASRSVTDIRISQQTEEAARAFSAAEAGIEEALVGTGTTFGGTFEETQTAFSAEKFDIGAENEFAFPGEYGTNEIQTLWLADHETLAKVYDRTALRVVWGNQGISVSNDQTPALEIAIYYNDGGTYKVGRFALDPYSSRLPDPSFCNSGEIGQPQCQNVESFSTSGESVGGKNFQFGATLDISGFRGGTKTLLFARLRLLYSNDSHILGAMVAGLGTSTSTFPSQGIRIESTGQAGGATRKVEISRLHPAPLPILDFVLYSTGGLIHQ